MQWQLEHTSFCKNDRNHQIYAKARVVLKDDHGNETAVMDFSKLEEYGQVSRSALIDSAYKLEQIAKEMKSHAERMR